MTLREIQARSNNPFSPENTRAQMSEDIDFLLNLIVRKPSPESQIIEQQFARRYHYFWIPCPNCGEMFGGHQVGKGSTPDPHTPGLSSMWCFRCDVFVEGK